MNKLDRFFSEDSEYVLNLPYHLADGGMADELRRILIDFDFAEYKVSISGPQPLVEDYDLASRSDIQIPEQAKNSLRLVQEVIRLSAHILADDKQQLAGQLMGRLLSCEAPEIQEILHQAQQRQQIWLRPLTPTLMPPGGGLLRTFSTVDSAGETVAITSDGQQIVAPADDNSLRVWDVRSGQELHILKGHTDLVRAIALTANGQRIVSTAEDKTLRVWDLPSENPVKTITAPGLSALAVAVTPDGQRAISTSEEHPLGVWDLQSGKALQVLRGHTGLVREIVLTPNGQQALSISWDGTLRVWDLKTGQTVMTLDEQGASGKAIAAANRKILALEMEGYGVIEAARQRFEQVRCLVIRALCDYADSTKNDAWHAYAAAVAAGFTKHFLLDEPLEPQHNGE